MTRTVRRARRRRPRRTRRPARRRVARDGPASASASSTTNTRAAGVERVAGQRQPLRAAAPGRARRRAPPAPPRRTPRPRTTSPWPRVSRHRSSCARTRSAEQRRPAGHVGDARRADRARRVMAELPGRDRRVTREAGEQRVEPAHLHLEHERVGVDVARAAIDHARVGDTAHPAPRRCAGRRRTAAASRSRRSTARTASAPRAAPARAPR